MSRGRADAEHRLGPQGGGFLLALPGEQLAEQPLEPVDRRHPQRGELVPAVGGPRTVGRFAWP